MVSTPITSRAWASPADLRALTAAMSRAWAGPKRPLIPGTAGDLEWWTALGGPDADWANRIRMWEADGRVVGWGWFRPPVSLDWFTDETLEWEDVRRMRGEILAWHADRARDARTGDGPVTLDTWAVEGGTEETLLRGLGWTPTEIALSQFLQPLDVDLGPPRVPDGYLLRHVRDDDDVPARIEAQRAAFAPSTLSDEKYALLPGLDHYRREHDLVLEAPDGSIAAFTICWLDPVGSVGEFEPVGTHPDHQRRGLGRVVMRAGLRLMREAGIRDALVFSERSNAASEALYQSAGFERIATHRQYTRPLEA